jgi:hypothetical protein
MTSKPSRRQWPLGLIGAVFGASVVRAIDPFLPGGPTTPASTVLVGLAEKKSPTGQVTTYVPREGKLGIELGLEPGTYRLTFLDLQGKVVRRLCNYLVEVSFLDVSSEEEWVDQGEQTTHYSYDGVRACLVSSPGAQKTTLTCSGSPRKDHGRHDDG